MRLYENRYISAPRRALPADADARCARARPGALRTGQDDAAAPALADRRQYHRPHTALDPRHFILIPARRPTPVPPTWNAACTSARPGSAASSAWHRRTLWRSRRSSSASAPKRIMAVNVAPGLLWFLYGLIGQIDGLALPPRRRLGGAGGRPAARVPGGGRRPRKPRPCRQRPAARSAPAESVMVLFSPNPGDTEPHDMLRAYAAFVSPPRLPGVPRHGIRPALARLFHQLVLPPRWPGSWITGRSSSTRP